MNKLNIGLNITKNVEKYNLFLDKIKIHLKDYSHCKYYNVSDLKNLNERISNLDVLLTYNINEDIYKKATNRLKWIHFGVAGVEKNLFHDIIKSKVILTNSKGIHARPVSEFILACILFHAKRFENCNEFKISQEWKQWDIAKTMVQLKNKTLGIIGYGEIGKATAKLAKNFGMNVLATRRLQKNKSSNRYVDSLIPISDINQIYQQSDFIAITCPLTPMTKQMISHDSFSKMKSTAYIINIARGEIIEEEALLSALNHNEIAGAALDVFKDEPLKKGHPYFNYDNLFLSPHISGNFPEYQNDMIDLFIDNLIRFLNQKNLKNRICKKRLY